MSYSSSTEVMAFTRHLMDGQSAFNTTTRPSMTEVTKFIVRTSAVMDSALAQYGFTTPVSNTTAKLAIDDWVTVRAAQYVELTQRGVGYSDGEGSRIAAFKNMTREALDFVWDNRLGFMRLGAAMAYKMSDGLEFTGQKAQADRVDRDDTSIVQPAITRGLFDNPDAEDDE